MKKWYRAAGLAAVMVAIVLSLPRFRIPEPAASLPPVEPPRISAKRGKTAMPRETKPPPSDPARVADAAAIIEAAVLTYQPAGVTSIRPYLLDPDPAIRQAARDGMVQLGEADAVALLRDAATRLEDPAEVASLREAADLLALPAWSDSEEAREAVEEIRGNP